MPFVSLRLWLSRYVLTRNLSVQYDPKNVTKERVLPGSGFQSVTHCGVTSKCFWWEEMDYLPLLSHDKGPVEVTSGVAYR